VTPVLLVHAGATLAMAGLIWFVQIVHYPLLGAVGPDAFTAYENAHIRRTGFVVTPLMFAELATAAWLAFAQPGAAAYAGLALLAVIWLSTGLLQAPAHGRLARGFDPALHRRLVRTNWIRTAAWTARGVLALLILA